VSNGNVRLKNLALRLLLQESNKVVLDERVISSRDVGNSREEDSFAGVSLRHGIRVFCGERVVPQLKESLDLVLRDRLWLSGLRHHRRVVL